MITADHYVSMVVAYAVALIGWFLASRTFRGVWPAAEVATFTHPRRETALVVAAAAATALIGPVIFRLKVPQTPPMVRMPLEALVQIAIFAPLLAIPLVRRSSLSTLWLAPRRLGVRAATGVVLALVALAVYSLVRENASAFPRLVGYVVGQPRNFGLFVQVALEDVGIALLATRMGAAFGERRSIFIVGALFAAGHIPAMVAGGSAPGEFMRLVADGTLAASVVALLFRARDIVWLVPVHFSLDMTQLYGTLRSG